LPSTSCTKNFRNSAILIDELKSSAPSFRAQFEQYAELDQKIEGLERRDSPIGDDSLHQLKQERVELKDYIYKVLTTKSKSA